MLDTITLFISFDLIVPFRTWYSDGQEFLLTIRRQLDHFGTPKAMLNIYKVDEAKMISNDTKSAPKNDFSHSEVNDACLIDSGIGEFS